MACVQSLPPRKKSELRDILDRAREINPTVGLMLELSALTGLRYCDYSGLAISDVMINDVVRDHINVVQKKGYSKRVTSGMSVPAAKAASQIRIPFSDQTKNVIRAALELNPDGKLLFESEIKVGTPYTAQFVNKTLKKVAKDLKLSYPLSGHSMRKCFALMVINGGAKIHVVRDLLGHSSLAVTDHYLSTFMEDNDKHVIKLNF